MSSTKQVATTAVSVIIPTRDRPARVTACVAALASQTLPRDRFEVIVVDDGSAVPLDAPLQPFMARINLRLIRQSNGGPAGARNAGARHAQGTLLAFTDDDCEPTPGWLSALIAGDDGVSALGGVTINALEHNVCADASQTLIDYLYAHHADTPSDVTIPFYTSNNLAVPAAAFHAAGGFDQSFPLAAGEDREFCDRWQQQGRPLRFVPDAVVRHAHDLSVRRFWRQHFNYGRGAYHFTQARLSKGLPMPGREPLSFYAGLIVYPLKAGRPQGLTLASLMVVSQVANVLGYARERFFGAQAESDRAAR